MGLIQDLRIKATAVKMIPSLIRKSDLELQEILDGLKDKYEINDYDYVLINVCIGLMSEKEMLIKKGGTSPYILEANDEQTL
jgi:hypothetical protein